jgi:hypothetical protein
MERTMAQLPSTPAASLPAPPAVPGGASDSHHRRPATPARREVLRRFREQVASGAYQPPVDALSGALASWLLRDGLADLERS